MADKSKKSVKKKGKLKELLAFDSATISSGATGRSRGRFSRQETLQLGLFNGRTRAIIGVDEVGRGCLAGPVVASAVMLKELDPRALCNREIRELDDSKKLSLEQRVRLSKAITENAYYAVRECSNHEIDQINILKASLLAMKRAIEDLFNKIPYGKDEVILLVDGNKRVDIKDLRQITVIKGDSLSASIAAASVVAKVQRDNLMLKLSLEFPQYLWHSNKGYPSVAHKDAIEAHGLTDWHRKTFRWQKSDDSRYDKKA